MRSFRLKAKSLKFLSVIVVTFTSVFQAGCDVDFGYLIPAAAGQLKLIQEMVSIEDAVASGKLTPEQIGKLELIQDVRSYAGAVVGLKIENNYTMFYDAGDMPVAINLSASRKDELRPKLWSFPIVGTVPYLGYFNLEAAIERRKQLESEGWDVFVYQIDAYSAVGFFPNPVLSPMLERDDVNLVETVMHELLHATIWRTNDTPFNESLATFVGRRGAEAYFADRFPDQGSFIEGSREQFEDIDRFTAFMLGVVDDLDEYYSSGLTSSTRIAGREFVIRGAGKRFERDILPLLNHPEPYTWIPDQLPINNAWFLGIRRYNLDLDVFDEVFEATGGDWDTSLALFREAANRPLPYDYLREWLASGDVATAAKINSATSNSIESSRGASSAANRGPCDLNLARTLIATEKPSIFAADRHRAPSQNRAD